MKTDVNFDKYIKAIMKKAAERRQVRISSATVEQLNMILNLVGDKVVKLAINLNNINDKKTIQVGSLSTAMSIINPEIAKYTNKYAKEAIVNFELNKNGDKAKRAKIILSPARVDKLIRKQVTKLIKVSELASVYLAGVLEQFCIDLIVNSIDQVIDMEQVTIMPDHLNKAIQDDSDLSDFTRYFGFDIAGGGVESYISRKLYPKGI